MLRIINCPKVFFHFNDWVLVEIFRDTFDECKDIKAVGRHRTKDNSWCVFKDEIDEKVSIFNYNNYPIINWRRK